MGPTNCRNCFATSPAGGLTGREVPGCYRRRRADPRTGGRRRSRGCLAGRRCGDRVGGCGRSGAGPAAGQPSVDHQHHQDRRRRRAGQSAQARRIVRTRAAARRPRRPATRTVRHAAGETWCPPTRSASWCSPATSSTRCARWACSRASSAAACPTARTSQPSYLGTVVHDAARRGHPQRARSGRDQGGQARPDPRLAGADARGVPAAVRDRPDGVHRRARRGVAGQPADRRRGDRARSTPRTG